MTKTEWKPCVWRKMEVGESEGNKIVHQLASNRKEFRLVQTSLNYPI